MDVLLHSFFISAQDADNFSVFTLLPLYSQKNGVPVPLRDAWLDPRDVLDTLDYKTVSVL